MHLAVPLALVDGPSATYEKAKVLITDGQLTVRNNRNRELAVVEGEFRGPDEDGVFVFAAADGVDWTIKRQRGCGCGGTRVTEK